MDFKSFKKMMEEKKNSTEYKEFKEQMKTKKVTLTGEEFAKVVSNVANDIAFEEGISEAMKFTFHVAKLTGLIFCNEEKENEE